MFMTPPRKRQDPVFKTPMTFSPRLTGDTARPSPSRFELWKEELGLDAGKGVDSGGKTPDSSGSHSEDETEVDQDFRGTQTNHFSSVEYQALKKELEERNSQRDELLYRIKTLTDKNKSYKSHLEREEACKRQQLKIMRRTHEAHLQEKLHLIRNLEDIVDEQEAKICTLEANHMGGSADNAEVSTSSGSSIKKLINQIEVLQQEKGSLTDRLILLEGDIETLRDQHRDELDTSQRKLERLEQEKDGLQEEIIQLRSLKNTGSTDAEKHACKLEIENDRMRRDLRQSQMDIVKLQNNYQTEDIKHIKKLREENDILRDRSEKAEAASESCRQEAETLEESLRAELKVATAEAKENARQVRDLSSKLSALQAKSPEVVTRVRKVEVDSAETIQDLASAKDEVTAFKTKLKAVQTQQVAVQVKHDSIAEELETLRIQHDRTQAELTKFQARCKAAQSDLEASQRHLQESERAAEEVKEAHHEKLHELEQRYMGSESSLRKCKNQISELKAKMRQCESELEEVRVKHATELAQAETQHQLEIAAAKLEANDRTLYLEDTLDKLRTQLAITQPQLLALVKEHRALKKQVANWPQTIKMVVSQTQSEVREAVENISTYNTELIRKYRKEMKLRKQYHNELVELRGNIRVFCRLRPSIREDGTGPGAEIVVGCDSEDDAIVHVAYKGRSQTFEVDKVFGEQVTQEQVFSEVQALVTSCIDGYNVCMFAYGQTGSGKTHTMEGNRSNPGINQRALQQLFAETAERSGEVQYHISVSVMEIYNEMLRDLLSAEPTFKMEIKMNADKELYVPGLTTCDVACVEDVNKVFDLAKRNRATATTDMNEHSSRSHALLCIHVVGTNNTTGAKTVGKLNLVDLAGSERVKKSGAEGARLEEAVNINKSLSSLGDVIQALRKKKKVPTATLR